MKKEEFCSIICEKLEPYYKIQNKEDQKLIIKYNFKYNLKYKYNMRALVKTIIPRLIEDFEMTDEDYEDMFYLTRVDDLKNRICDPDFRKKYRFLKLK